MPRDRLLFSLPAWRAHARRNVAAVQQIHDTDMLDVSVWRVLSFLRDQDSGRTVISRIPSCPAKCAGRRKEYMTGPCAFTDTLTPSRAGLPLLARRPLLRCAELDRSQPSPIKELRGKPVRCQDFCRGGRQELHAALSPDTGKYGPCKVK